MLSIDLIIGIGIENHPVSFSDISFFLLFFVPAKQGNKYDEDQAYVSFILQICFRRHHNKDSGQTDHLCPERGDLLSAPAAPPINFLT